MPAEMRAAFAAAGESRLSTRRRGHIASWRQAACVLTLVITGTGIRAGEVAQDQAKATPEQTALVEALAAAGDDTARTALLQGNERLKTPDLVDAILRYAQAHEATGPAAGQALYRVARQLSQDLHYTQGSLNSLFALGIADGRLANYDAAMASFEQAAREAEAAHLPKLVAMACSDMGIIHRRRGDYDLASASYAHALAIQQSLANEAGQASVLNNLGNIALDQGNLRLALDDYERSLAIRQKLSADPTTVVTNLLNIGAVYVSQGDSDLALDYLQKAQATWTNAVGAETLAAIYNDIGKAYQLRGAYDQAVTFFDKELEFSDRLNLRAQSAVALYNIAEVSHSRGDLARALASYEKSLAIREQLADKHGIAETLTGIGDVLLGLKRLEDARATIDRATSLARDIAALSTLWSAETTAGRIAEAAGERGAAERSFRDAIATIEHLREAVAGGTEQRQRFFETKQDPYQALTGLLVEQGRADEALGVAERAKARVLLEVLDSGGASITKAMTPEERDRERALRRSIVLLSSQLSSARSRAVSDTGRIDSTAARLAAAEKERDDFRGALYAAHPGLKAQRGDLPIVDRASLAALIGSHNRAALEFEVTSNRAFLFVTRLGSDQANPSKRDQLITHAYSIPIKREDLAAAAQDFRGRIAARDLDIRSAARRLHDLLLGAASADLAGVTDLLVVPDGPLWELPFQALMAPSGKWLVEQYAITLVPSWSALREMHRNEPRRSAADAPLNAVVLGSSGAPGAKEPPGREVKMGGERGPSLPLLREAETQARAIGRIYGRGARLYVGAEARPDRLTADGERARVIHIAAHGVLDDESPLQSYLVLSPGSSGGPDAGRLDASEMMQMNLGADLVVLSACETGRGRVGEGEGLIGLSWALFVAGVPSAVVSQWQVDAASTTALMTDFHQRINAVLSRSGRVASRSAALRRAALDMLKGRVYTHPFYWAPFVMMGDGS